MTKKIILDVIVLFATYLVPLFVLHQHQDDWRNIYAIQKIILGIIFLGSILLIYLNNKNRKQDLTLKWLWLSMITIGIIGLFGSVFILFLIFSFRNFLT